MPPAWNKRQLLGPGDLTPSHEDWEVIGVFNPGATLVDGEVILLVRVAERPQEQRSGYVGLPRWDAMRGAVIDWVAENDTELIDPRVIRIKSSGCVRLTFVSHLRVVSCGEGAAVRRIEEIRFEPLAAWEEFGVEDPRVTNIDGRYWVTYVAVSRHGAVTALASTSDFRRFERHGIIFPPENKDVVLLPERIRGQYVAVHRPNGSTRFTAPEMWIARSDDLIHWGGHEPLYAGESDWEADRVGAGAPPIKIAEGWLEVYHGNRQPATSGEVGCYQAAAMLLAGDNPARVLRRTFEPILSPMEPFERQGFVSNVVFPTGIVERGDTLLVYYGAGDTYTAVAEVPLDELITRLRPVD